MFVEPVIPEMSDGIPSAARHSKPYTSGKPKAGDTVSPFAARGMDLLKRIEYRPVTSSFDLEELYRFRYACYHNAGMCASNDQEMICDRYDQDPQVMRFALWLDGKMVSSIRIQHVRPDRRVGVSVVGFPDLLNGLLDNGCSFIDSSRFVTDPIASRENRMLPHLTVRLAAMATLHFKADYCLSMVRAAHSAFYQKLSLSRPVSEVIRYPGVSFGVQLNMSDARATGEEVLARYPFLHSMAHERRMLFGAPEERAARPEGRFVPHPDTSYYNILSPEEALPGVGSRHGPQLVHSAPLTVLPTAHLATAALARAA